MTINFYRKNNIKNAGLACLSIMLNLFSIGFIIYAFVSLKKNEFELIFFAILTIIGGVFNPMASYYGGLLRTVNGNCSPIKGGDL